MRGRRTAPRKPVSLLVAKKKPIRGRVVHMPSRMTRIYHAPRASCDRPLRFSSNPPSQYRNRLLNTSTAVRSRCRPRQARSSLPSDARTAVPSPNKTGFTTQHRSAVERSVRHTNASAVRCAPASMPDAPQRLDRARPVWWTRRIGFANAYNLRKTAPAAFRDRNPKSGQDGGDAV